MSWQCLVWSFGWFWSAAGITVRGEEPLALFRGGRLDLVNLDAMRPEVRHEPPGGAVVAGEGRLGVALAYYEVQTGLAGHSGGTGAP